MSHEYKKKTPPLLFTVTWLSLPFPVISTYKKILSCLTTGFGLSLQTSYVALLSGGLTDTLHWPPASIGFSHTTRYFNFKNMHMVRYEEMFQNTNLVPPVIRKYGEFFSSLSLTSSGRSRKTSALQDLTVIWSLFQLLLLFTY